MCSVSNHSSKCEELESKMLFTHLIVKLINIIVEIPVKMAVKMTPLKNLIEPEYLQKCSGYQAMDDDGGRVWKLRHILPGL